MKKLLLLLLFLPTMAFATELSEAYTSYADGVMSKVMLAMPVFGVIAIVLAVIAGVARGPIAAAPHLAAGVMMCFTPNLIEVFDATLTSAVEVEQVTQGDKQEDDDSILTALAVIGFIFIPIGLWIISNHDRPSMPSVTRTTNSTEGTIPQEPAPIEELREQPQETVQRSNGEEPEQAVDKTRRKVIID